MKFSDVLKKYGGSIPYKNNLYQLGCIYADFEKELEKIQQDIFNETNSQNYKIGNALDVAKDRLEQQAKELLEIED